MLEQQTAHEVSPLPRVELAGSPDQQLARLSDWHRAAHLLQIGYMRKSARYAAWSKGTGALIAALTAFTGTTVFTSFSSANSQGVKIMAAVFSVLAVVAASAQTAVSPGKRSATFQVAANGFGKLRRAMEEWRLEHPRGSVPEDVVVKDWAKQWNDTEGAAPALPQRDFEGAKRYVEERAAATPDPWFRGDFAKDT